MTVGIEQAGGFGNVAVGLVEGMLDEQVFGCFEVERKGDGKRAVWWGLGLSGRGGVEEVEVLGGNGMTGGFDEGAFEDVSEFADIAGEMVGFKLRKGFGAQRRRIKAHFCRQEEEKVTGKQGDVAAPLPERWDPDGEASKSEVEILAESAFIYSRL
jgi:hypothetical protein